MSTTERIVARLSAALLVLVLVAIVEAHDTEITPLVVGSSAAGGGTLVVTRADNDPVLVTPSVTVGGFVLYTAADPSFETPESADGAPFPLADGTKVTVEVTGLDETVAMKLRGETLDAIGASVVLGTMPALHAHPEWQLTLPEGETSCQTIRFRLTAESGYAPSSEYVVQVGNDVATCPVLPTPTPADPNPTPTPLPGTVCGDADGSGAVTVTDGVTTLRTAAGLSAGCEVPARCDVDGSGAVSVTDGVNVLRAAAGLPATLTCPDL